MNLPDIFAPGWTAVLVNHLWQSTTVALLAWLLTFALRDNEARIRYAIWMIASIKFLVPFSLLTRIGEHWSKPVFTKPGAPAVYSIIEEFSMPFRHLPATGSGRVAAYSMHADLSSIACALIAGVWVCGCFVVLVRWISAWRRTAVLAREAEAISEGREFDALRRAERRTNIGRPIALAFSSREIEPGVFGMIRPVLLWPIGLSNRLDDVQIDAIMVHEVEHVRRRDNLTTAIHAAVEALFWFHPLVRWMTARLNEERERACDESVLERNAKPEVYAESIMKVCAFCLEPPTPCVAGVSGADLKDRILRIMTKRSGVALGLGRKLALAAAAGLVVLMPVGFGVLHGQEAQSPTATASQPSGSAQGLPKYEVATVKPAPENDGRHVMMMTPGGTTLKGVPLQMVLQQAFGVEEDRILGAPGWVKSNRYDIEAKVAPEDAPKMEKLKAEQRRQMLLPVLVERFNLKYHVEKRELPIYALVIAKGGPKLTESKPDDSEPHEFPDPKAGSAAPGHEPPANAGPTGPGRDPMGRRGMVSMGPGRIDAHGGGMEFLTHTLSFSVNRTVLDETGLKGKYDFALHWTPDQGTMPTGGPGGEGGSAHGDVAADAGGPSLFTALEEQLGLKLESQKSKVDVIVIDHINLPSEN